MYAFQSAYAMGWHLETVKESLEMPAHLSQNPIQFCGSYWSNFAKFEFILHRRPHPHAFQSCVL